jgi:hypothetical protein
MKKQNFASPKHCISLSNEFNKVSLSHSQITMWNREKDTVLNSLPSSFEVSCLKSCYDSFSNNEQIVSIV